MQIFMLNYGRLDRVEIISKSPHDVPKSFMQRSIDVRYASEQTANPAQRGMYDFQLAIVEYGKGLTTIYPEISVVLSHIRNRGPAKKPHPHMRRQSNMEA